jgi:hypothetical protein
MRKVNPVFAPLARTSKRYAFNYGGAGSGKSVFSAQNCIQKCLRNEHHKILLVRKYKTDVRDSCFAQVKKELSKSGLKSKVHIRENAMEFDFPNGAQILGRGLDDSERIKSIEGITVIWIEEANEITEKDFNMLDLRLRGSKPVDFQIILTFNPAISKSHWIRKRFFEGNKVNHPDAFALKTTYRDNVYADKKYEEILSNLDDELKAIYKYGDFYDVADPDQVIKDRWIDAAFERDPDSVDNGESKLGVDVARFGDDETSMCYMEGDVVRFIETRSKQSTSETARDVMMLMDIHGIRGVNVAVDTVGLGAGTADTLEDNDIAITPFVAGGKTITDDIARESFFQFKNIRSQAWWYLRTKMQKGQIAFDFDPNSSVAQRLREDLTAPRYRVKGEREIEVEPKQGTSNWGLSTRLGRSTDEGDSLVQANMVSRMGNRVDYSNVLA